MPSCSNPPAPRDPTHESVRKKIASGEASAAVQEARRLLSRAEVAHGARSIEAARALDLLAECLVAANGVRHPDALDTAGRALRIKEALLPPDDPELAISLQSLGALHYRRGEYERARPLLERALSIRDRRVGPRSQESAETLLYLAALESDTGSDRGALPLLERSLANYELGMPKSATQLALCWNTRGGILYRTGDYPGAIASFDRSILLSERQGPGHEPAVGRTLFNLGGVLLTLGDLERASEVLERSLEIRRRVYGPRSDVVGTTYFSLGAAREGVGDLVAARRSYEKAVEIGEEAGGPDGERLVHPLLGLARIDAAEGEVHRAIPRLRRALFIREKALGTEHPSIAEVLVPLAESYISLGDTSRAAASLTRALKVQTERLGPGHPETGLTLEVFAAYHQRFGATQQALEEALRAEKIGREHLRLVALGLPEHQALSYAGVRTSGLDRALSILGGGRADPTGRRKVWEALIHSRNIVLDESARRLRWMSRSSDPRVSKLAGSWSESRQRLAALAVRGPAPGESQSHYRAEVERVRGEADELERALAQSDPQGSRSTRPAGALEISRALPRDTALISYVRHSAGFGAFVLSPGESIPAFIPLGSAGEVDSSISRWVGTVWSAIGRDAPALEQACRAEGARVRRLVFDPIRPSLRGAKRVLVVPDGMLHQVNFYALPERGGYLIETGPIIHELTCERDLVEPIGSRPGGPASRGNALIVGGPDFDALPRVEVTNAETGPRLRVKKSRSRVAVRSATNPCPELGSLHFSTLPGSRQEAEEVASMWQRSGRKLAGDAGGARATVLTGREATEGAVKNAAAGKELLHLATHGYYLGDCGSSRPSARGISTTSPSASAQKPLLISDRPLLLSGLALAGANRRRASRTEREDGILTAEEIAGMNLSGTEWAVLSGCQTGLGRMHRSEGVVGLRRAFRIAGARTLILSLWPVEDQAARVWMRGLYEARWKSHMDTAESVREASLRVLRERRAQARSTHPWSWASFVAAGDWN